MADDRHITLKADETTIRWFGHYYPTNHGDDTRVPIPAGDHCGYCSKIFDEDAQGYGIPHLGQDVMSFYHQPCLMQWLGMDHLFEDGDQHG